jgi:guanyl-specific ribonuclease Sa
MRRASLPLVIALLLAAFWLGGLRSPAPDTAPGSEAASDGLPVPAEVGAGDEPALADGARRPGTAPASAAGWLSPEAVETLALIEAGGPFPYRRDGVTFENRERLLPAQPRGYYREYTVPTPGARDRGARRIVAGGDPPEVFYYTADHYRSFRRVEGPP